MSNLGELFRQIRLSKNWSIREAAKKMGIAHSYLSILEKGLDPRTGKYANPKPDTLRLISKAYDYPYEELMKAAGYLNEDIRADRNFDFTVFISNLNLIMGQMTVEEFSEDIFRKTGYDINTKQIRSYINGDIEPFPGTINILSNYARVTPDFWYCFNTEETLSQEREKYEENFIKSANNQLTKDYYLFLNLKDDIRNWILKEDSYQYLSILKEAYEKKIKPTSIKFLIDTIENHRTAP